MLYSGIDRRDFCACDPPVTRPLARRAPRGGRIAEASRPLRLPSQAAIARETAGGAETRMKRAQFRRSGIPGDGDLTWRSDPPARTARSRALARRAGPGARRLNAAPHHGTGFLFMTPKFTVNCDFHVVVGRWRDLITRPVTRTVWAQVCVCHIPSRRRIPVLLS
jgi:hypothetical protein